jgi:outer membrane immunogenic protein
MLRKTQVLGAGLIILATSSANSGFYAGIGTGSDTVDFAMRSRVTGPNPGHPANFDVINKSHASATGIFGSLFAGYGALAYKKFYFAAEANGTLSATESNGYNFEFIHKSFSQTVIKLKNTIGISVLPGYQFSPDTLFYGRLGLTNSTLQVNTSDISLANFTRKKNGFRYGLGIKQNITNRLALRMDYSRITYNGTNTSTFDPVGVVIKATHMSPNEQLVEFGLIFNFA